jgi:kynureninase
MERDYAPHAGIRRFLAGTPPILGLAAVEEGAKLTAEAGVAALHEKAIALTERMIALHDAWLAPLGFGLATPRDPAARGSHVALTHPQAWQITRALIERAGVVPDFRGPDAVRLGVAPLYTRHVDVHDALQRLRDLVALGAHREVDPTPGRIT